MCRPELPHFFKIVSLIFGPYFCTLFPHDQFLGFLNEVRMWVQLVVTGISLWARLHLCPGPAGRGCSGASHPQCGTSRMDESFLHHCLVYCEAMLSQANMKTVVFPKYTNKRDSTLHTLGTWSAASSQHGDNNMSDKCFFSAEWDKKSVFVVGLLQLSVKLSFPRELWTLLSPHWPLFPRSLSQDVCFHAWR